MNSVFVVKRMLFSENIFFWKGMFMQKLYSKYSLSRLDKVKNILIKMKKRKWLFPVKRENIVNNRQAYMFRHTFFCVVVCFFQKSDIFAILEESECLGLGKTLGCAASKILGMLSYGHTYDCPRNLHTHYHVPEDNLT